MNLMSRWIGFLALVGSLFLTGASAWAGQPLETESTRLLPAGRLELEAGFEHQRSSDGTESAVPLAIEYGITDRLQILVEPVPYSRIHDSGLVAQTGIGDVEVTTTTLLHREGNRSPGLALAAEVKVPTAKNIRIGSGETDYSVYGIAGKRFGRWDTQANLGYTIVGSPGDVPVNNMLTAALSGEYRWKEHWDLVGEVFGNTGAQPGSEGETRVPSITPEIAGAEVVGSLGARYHSWDGLTWSLGLSIDTNAAILVHPGITFLW